jgi:hypothetical protein
MVDRLEHEIRAIDQEITLAATAESRTDSNLPALETVTLILSLANTLESAAKAGKALRDRNPTMQVKRCFTILNRPVLKIDCNT